MAPQLKPSSTLNATVRAPIVDKEGKATWGFLKVLQDWDQRITNSLNALGELIGQVAPTVQIGSTDNLTDGVGSPLAGGKEAFLALVPGAVDDVLTYDGTSWGPAPLPTPAVGVDQIVAGTGITISPPGGTGVVTVNATAVGGYSLGGALTTGDVALGPGAGTGAVLNAVAGLDGNHQIQVTTGTSPVANGVVFTVTFTTSRGHVTWPIIKCTAVQVGHTAIDLSPGGSGSATTYQAFNTGLDASTSYDWNISCP